MDTAYLDMHGSGCYVQYNFTHLSFVKLPFFIFKDISVNT